MQKKITLFTLSLMMGMQMVIPPSAKSLESSSIIGALLAVGPVNTVLLMSDNDDDPVDGTSSSGNSSSSSGNNSSSNNSQSSSSSGNNSSSSGTNLSGESCSESEPNSGFDKVMEGALDVLSGGNSQIKDIGVEDIK